jgi:hypothetical protein
MGLAEMLAGTSTHPARHTEEAEHADSRMHAENSLRAAHEAMQRGSYAEAHDHMSDWSEHCKKINYDKASEPQGDSKDEASRGLVVVQHGR